MEAPPVLTAERIDAMLSILAEVCLESVVEAGRRQKAAEDFDEFERGGRALQRAGRNLRQTIALKQRHDREQARKAADARELAEAQRVEAERVGRERVRRKRAGVERHFERLLWDEYDSNDAENLFEALVARLYDAASDDDFLETPIEALIQRLSDEIGLADASEEPPTPAPEPVDDGKRPPAAKPHSTAEAADVSAEIAETPRRGVLSETSATSAVQPGVCGPPEAPPPVTAEAPPGPRPPPPDPPPEPYLPPWERLQPGQRMPGGAGW